MNPLILIALLGGGFLLLSGSKPKPTSVSAVKFQYNCGSLKLTTSFSVFAKSLIPKVQKLFKERDITSSNILQLTDTQVIDLSKYWIYKLNSACVKFPEEMSENEKILYFVLFSILFVKMIQLSQGVPLNTDYVISDDPNLSIITSKIRDYALVLQKYLGINYSEEQIAEITANISNAKQFP